MKRKWLLLLFIIHEVHPAKFWKLVSVRLPGRACQDRVMNNFRTVHKSLSAWHELCREMWPHSDYMHVLYLTIQYGVSAARTGISRSFILLIQLGYRSLLGFLVQSLVQSMKNLRSLSAESTAS